MTTRSPDQQEAPDQPNRTASKAIGDVTDMANDAVVNDARDLVADLEALLIGPERTPVDIEKLKAELTQDEDLGTPDGGLKRVPMTPNSAKASGAAKASRSDDPIPIELIHFGRVHRDGARTFESSAPLLDTNPTLLVTPGRGIYYRAALEREAVLLAGVARSIETALGSKEKQEGKLGGLMKLAADLVGGSGGTAASIAAADMKPFTDKVRKIWDTINKPEISYPPLHKAGIDLNSVRANLTGYMLAELKKGKKGSPQEPSAPGILSDLPLMGELPLPAELGQIVSMFRKVGGKLHDVQNALLFGLNVAMLPAIESAAHRISIDTIRDARVPIYPVWALSLDPAAQKKPARPPLAALKQDDPLQGDLATIGKAVNDAVQDGVSSANDAVNSAAKEPLELVDLLSREVKKAPGHRYLDEAFQAATGEKSALGGSEKLGEIAVSAFYSAVSEDIPGFMEGFVQDFVGYVFAVCVEFLRSTYRVLCSLEPKEMVSTAEIVAAGTTHLLTHLIDFLTAKLGLDDLLKKLSFEVPALPRDVPGINWPAGEKLSAAPIADDLKTLFVEKAGPFLEPVVELAMSGLGMRLNAQRLWARGSVMTMEAHLAQLPSELALLFRDLFGPLWSFITDTCMSVISDVIGKALGPAGDALGVVGDKLGVASGFIADAQKKATELKGFAEDLENKVDTLIKELSTVQVGGSQGDKDLQEIDDAAGALMGAAGSDPFSKKKGKGSVFDDDAQTFASFPSDREARGEGIKITPADVAKVVPQYPKARPKQPPAAAAKADAPAEGGA